MKSSTPDAQPGQIPAGQVLTAQVTAGEPAAGNARPTALTARLAGLAAFTADLAAAILEGAPF
jgi:hypothetical protein